MYLFMAMKWRRWPEGVKAEAPASTRGVFAIVDREPTRSFAAAQLRQVRFCSNLGALPQRWAYINMYIAIQASVQIDCVGVHSVHLGYHLFVHLRGGVANVLVQFIFNIFCGTGGQIPSACARTCGGQSVRSGAIFESCCIDIFCMYITRSFWRHTSHRAACAADGRCDRDRQHRVGVQRSYINDLPFVHDRQDLTIFYARLLIPVQLQASSGLVSSERRRQTKTALHSLDARARAP